MGTNYYWTKRENECKHCGRADEINLHIGKSSGGWCFSLHVYPADEFGYCESGQPILTLEDWKTRFADPNSVITDEYGDVTSAEQMLNTITNRSWSHRIFVSPAEHWENYSMAGPNGLLRHDPTREYSHCIGHGEGTWDYIVGEFS